MGKYSTGGILETFFSKTFQEFHSKMPAVEPFHFKAADISGYTTKKVPFQVWESCKISQNSEFYRTTVSGCFCSW